MPPETAPRAFATSARRRRERGTGPPAARQERNVTSLLTQPSVLLPNADRRRLRGPGLAHPPTGTSCYADFRTAGNRAASWRACEAAEREHSVHVVPEIREAVIPAVDHDLPAPAIPRNS